MRYTDHRLPNKITDKFSVLETYVSPRVLSPVEKPRTRNNKLRLAKDLIKTVIKVSKQDYDTYFHFSMPSSD